MPFVAGYVLAGAGTFAVPQRPPRAALYLGYPRPSSQFLSSVPRFPRSWYGHAPLSADTWYPRDTPAAYPLGASRPRSAPRPIPQGTYGRLRAS